MRGALLRKMRQDVGRRLAVRRTALVSRDTSREACHVTQPMGHPSRREAYKPIGWAERVLYRTLSAHFHDTIKSYTTMTRPAYVANLVACCN